MLSRVISEQVEIKITFSDGDYLIDHLRWHTHGQLGLKTGKVVNKSLVKYWEPVTPLA